MAGRWSEEKEHHWYTRIVDTRRRQKDILQSQDARREAAVDNLSTPSLMRLLHAMHMVVEKRNAMDVHPCTVVFGS